MCKAGTGGMFLCCFAGLLIFFLLLFLFCFKMRKKNPLHLFVHHILLLSLFILFFSLHNYSHELGNCSGSGKILLVSWIWKQGLKFWMIVWQRPGVVLWNPTVPLQSERLCYKITMCSFMVSIFITKIWRCEQANTSIIDWLFEVINILSVVTVTHQLGILSEKLNKRTQ